MRVRWENVFAVLLTVGLVLLLTRGGKLAELLAQEGLDPEGLWPEVNMPRLLVYGLILITFAAIVKLLISRSR